MRESNAHCKQTYTQLTRFTTTETIERANARIDRNQFLLSAKARNPVKANNPCQRSDSLVNATRILSRWVHVPAHGTYCAICSARLDCTSLAQLPDSSSDADYEGQNECE